MGTKDELFKVKTLTEAVNLLKPYAFAFYEQQEEVLLLNALGRIISRDITAECNLPHFRKSTVDGLAVRAGDTFGASEAMPALIQVKGQIEMGKIPGMGLGQGEGMLIPTGGMLPEDADAVVMVEHLEDFKDGLYGVLKPVAPGDNLIETGEDFRHGEKLFDKFTKIRAQEMGVLAAQGIMNVPVLRRWRVGIVSTGDEIVAPEIMPESAQTRDINGYTLYGQVVAAGGVPTYYGIVRDNVEEIRERLKQMLLENDLILLSGGSSVGYRDLSAELINELGEPGLLFHGLALRPGKPTIGGAIGNKIVLGLPGHPASAMIVFEALVRPLLEGELLREELSISPYVEGTLTQNIYSGTGREEYVRVQLAAQGEDWLVEPIRGKSGLISTMARADALLKLDLASEGVEAGSRVRVRLLR